jgi:hypothetical protein
LIDRAQLVVLSDVLEHVADDFQLLSELLAAAAPGTFFLLTVPADLALWSQHDRAFGHYRRYDRQRLVQLWSGLPVSAPLVSYYNARLYPLVRMVRSWNQWRGGTRGVAGTDFQLPPEWINNLLIRAFRGEQHRLVRLATGQSNRPYGHGVSLMALLERLPGTIEPRVKPVDVACDVHDPAAELVTSGA